MLCCAQTQGRPSGNEEPGVGPVLRRCAGEPEAAAAEMAVEDGRPLGLWTRLRPGGETGATLQTPLQRTLMLFSSNVTDVTSKMYVLLFILTFS